MFIRKNPCICLLRQALTKAELKAQPVCRFSLSSQCIVREFAAQNPHLMRIWMQTDVQALAFIFAFMQVRCAESLKFNGCLAPDTLSTLQSSEWPASKLHTWKIVFNRGFPAPASRPTSFAHIFTRSTSAIASAKRELCRSKELSSSPRSRPSLPSRSRTMVKGSFILSERANQIPFVV
jgi:hypothetical protein